MFMSSPFSFASMYEPVNPSTYIYLSTSQSVCSSIYQTVNKSVSRFASWLTSLSVFLSSNLGVNPAILRLFLSLNVNVYTHTFTISYSPSQHRQTHPLPFCFTHSLPSLTHSPHSGLYWRPCLGCKRRGVSGGGRTSPRHRESRTPSGTRSPSYCWWERKKIRMCEKD